MWLAAAARRGGGFQGWRTCPGSRRCSCCGGLSGECWPCQARPRNTARARLTVTMAASSRRPNAGPILARNGVCGLSTMTCDGLVNPFPGVGSTSTRTNGASTSVPVIGRTVTAGRSAKASAWMIKAGRGLPCSPCRATVTSRLVSLSPAGLIRSVEPGVFSGRFGVTYQARLPGALRREAAGAGVWNPNLHWPQPGGPQFVPPAPHPPGTAAGLHHA